MTAPAVAPTLRPCTAADLPAVQAIYAHAVRHGTGTFELVPPSVDDMAARHQAIAAAGWPWLVAEREGRVLGYAYAGTFRPRPAYRFCVEDSVYIAPEAQGQGIGRLLLAELVARCEQRGARQMLALIGDADNAGSIALHRALGFQPTGRLASAGWKFGRWLDVVLMQKPLGPGAHAAPEADQLSSQEPT